MECPKCGEIQSNEVECESCGIYFDKYKKYLVTTYPSQKLKKSKQLYSASKTDEAKKVLKDVLEQSGIDENVKLEAVEFSLLIKYDNAIDLLNKGLDEESNDEFNELLRIAREENVRCNQIEIEKYIEYIKFKSNGKFKEAVSYYTEGDLVKSKSLFEEILKDNQCIDEKSKDKIGEYLTLISNRNSSKNNDSGKLATAINNIQLERTARIGRYCSIELPINNEIRQDETSHEGGIASPVEKIVSSEELKNGEEFPDNPSVVTLLRFLSILSIISGVVISIFIDYAFFYGFYVGSGLISSVMFWAISSIVENTYQTKVCMIKMLRNQREILQEKDY
ncbi:hypothetical protein [Desulfopila aestuarii]|uniref:Tetratricopeptide repeat-containing protein n=1 Tax=Desulfopila aestuarii DSM 18488 TaxID=1121416 RepID=A0A1M7YBX8_9BACT|nr:hypothetical protein [Desulfopila aestuarii]SHO50086.1 hypothetical protein SAMN02745220_03243 [Desulfopila aestuarii DSM 18488]